MSTAWVTIALLCLATVTIKAAGPVLLGDRRPSRRALGVIALIGPAVLGSLIVFQTFSGHPDGVELDARVAGLAAAGLAIAARMPMIAVIVVAAGVTAAVRALTG